MEEAFTPDCAACPRVEPTPEAARILEIHSRIRALKGLVDGGTILRMYGAGMDDLEMLALVEEVLLAAAKEPEAGGNNGDAF